MAESITRQIYIRKDPELKLERNPDLVASFKAYLDSTGSGEAYAAQHSTSFLISFEGDYIGHEQINPQAAQPANETVDAPNGDGQVFAPTGQQEKPGAA